MESEQMKEARISVENNPFAKLLGIEVLEAEEGFIKARMTCKPELLNNYGGYHGGALFALADQCGGMAAQSHGYYVTTVSGNIQYMRAGQNTEYITCEARTIKSGKNITVEEVSIFDDRQMLLDTVNFTYFRVKDKIPAGKK